MKRDERKKEIEIYWKKQEAIERKQINKEIDEKFEREQKEKLRRKKRKTI